MTDEAPEGLGRRDLLKRGAMVGGALVWTVPAVQSLAGPAFAVGSVPGDSCSYQVEITVRDANGNITGTSCRRVVATSSACCAAILAALDDGINGIREALGSTPCLNVGTETNCS